MKKFFRNNGLSLTLAILFLGFWGCQAIAGFKVYNEANLEHGRPPVKAGEYLVSGHFWQATGENWESEFLQMGAYVIMTSFLFQKGSAESRDPDKAQTKESRNPSGRSWLYRNSLELAFLFLFLAAFAIHASGGLVEFNEERAEHGQGSLDIIGFLEEPEFWFQSFQNWQSEFLAVLAIVLLTIFLRQEGSPESKHVDAPNSQTGD